MRLLSRAISDGVALTLIMLASLAVARQPTPLDDSLMSIARAKGLDVSHWNGVIDWIRVAGDGYSFIFGSYHPFLIDWYGLFIKLSNPAQHLL